MAQDKTIVEIAVGNKDFTKLVAALKAAGLVEALSGEGPFTVFAPTDAAFDALGEETLKAVLADKKKLTAILTYHVIKGKVPAADALALAKDGKSAKTLNGAEIKLSIKDGSLYLNGTSKVIKTDIFGKNGVIHVIDKVLLPPTGASGTGSIKMIEKSIDRGVALYNAGHQRECAMLYQQTALHLVHNDADRMPTNVQRRLMQTLSSVNVCSQPRESAWALRHALDEAYDVMMPARQDVR
jgi:uncharacterized surface protein with fasciclin (FAS1) repeats